MNERTKIADDCKFARRDSKRWYEGLYHHQLCGLITMQIAIFKADPSVAQAVYCKLAGASQFQAAIAMGMHSANALPRILARMETRYGFSADQVHFLPRGKLYLGSCEARIGVFEMVRDLQEQCRESERLSTRT
jgi:hypothetical protein